MVPATWRRSVWAGPLLVLLALTSSACTTEADDPLAETAQQPQNQAKPVESTEPVEQTPFLEGDEDPDPARRIPSNTTTDGDGFWIAWVSMSESMAELTWSEAGLGGDDPVRYRLYRVETLGTDVSEVELSAENLVYQGDAQSFTDSNLQSAVFYTYIVVAQSGKLVSPRRWTEVVAITDTTPPTEISGLRASRTPDGVLLVWNRSKDDVEFGAYSVSLVEGDQFTYIGGGADESQNSFLDTQAPSGSLTYAVQAVDFHNNRSEPALITVE